MHFVIRIIVRLIRFLKEGDRIKVGINSGFSLLKECEYLIHKQRLELHSKQIDALYGTDVIDRKNDPRQYSEVQEN